MSTKIRYKSFDQLSFTDIMVYSKLPAHPFWSHVESKIDFTFADRLCSVLYSGRGQYPFAPSLKLKIHLVQAYYNLSDRLAEEKIIGDLFVKRFLGLPVEFFGFDHSTIGLDRTRMGTAMFQACHLYILAQMYSLRLWGDRNEQWIVDSFPCNAGVALVSAYRLIQQGMVRVLQHLKRNFEDLYKQACESIPLDSLTVRLHAGSSTKERLLAFSNLVARAHGLLCWFETETVSLLFWNWSNKAALQKSIQLQTVLKQILEENSRPTNLPTSDPGAGSDTSIPDDSTTTSEQEAQSDLVSEAVVEFEKIPRKERTSHRIISADQPDARIGMKSRFQIIKGYKTQTLCTTNGVILQAGVVPASELDHVAMYNLVHEIQKFFAIKPNILLGDTAYGYGKQRMQLETIGIRIVAPVAAEDKTGKYSVSAFTYNREMDRYTCPNNIESYRKSRSKSNEGCQYHFSKKVCGSCSLREKCTESKTGRTIFRSDYSDIYEQAQAFNETSEGKALLQERYLVERKNQELKNDCGLGQPQTKSRAALQIKATLAAVIVNLKHTVRRFFSPSLGFIRRVKHA